MYTLVVCDSRKVVCRDVLIWWFCSFSKSVLLNFRCPVCDWTLDVHCIVIALLYVYRLAWSQHQWSIVLDQRQCVQ